MTGDALVDQFVIGLDGVLQLHATRAQLLHRLVDIGGGEREVLDAFAVVIADEFLDLALVILALVQRDADRAIRRDHRLAEQARRLALDVEILLLLEAEELVVEGRPHAHLAALHIVGEVVEQVEPDIILGCGLLPASNLLPLSEGIAVDQIEQRAADALNRLRAGEGAGRGVGVAGAALQCDAVGVGGVRDLERHAVGGRAMLGAECGRMALAGVEDEGDATLAIERQLARGHLGGGHEAELLKLGAHLYGIGRGELAEREAVEAERVRVIRRHGDHLRIR